MHGTRECESPAEEREAWGVADASSAPPRGQSARRQPPGRRPLAGLLADIGLSLIAYYGLHALGASDRLALTAAAAAAAARLVWEAWRTKRVTWFAAIMLSVFGAGALLTLTGGDPRTILLKDSAGTALIGAVFLLSLAGRAPLTLAAAQAWHPGHAERLAHSYRDDDRARRAFRVTTLGWGFGMLAESAVRVPLVYLLPVDVMVGLSTALMIAAMAALVVWNAVYIARAARRTPALRILLPGVSGW